jgi:adenylate cyclase
LRSADADQETLESASAEGRLGTLAVEVALGGAPRYTVTHVARGARLEPAFLRQVLRAHGRPDPGVHEPAYSDQDIRFARLIRRFLDAGIPCEGILEIARVLSQTMAQTADTVRRVVGDTLLRPGDSELTLGLRYAQTAEELGPLMGPLLEYHLRAHVRDGVRRELITEAERERGQLAGTREVAVAFADLVGYTRLGHTLPAEEVGHIATRLAELAQSAVRQPAQLVKTIGDAAMFVSPEIPTLLETITTLLASVHAPGEQIPDVRIGITHGPATPRAGDWFGATVNLANRVTAVARPGEVVATQAVTERAGEDYAWKRTRRHAVRGIDGRPRLFSLERAGP